MLLRAVHAEHVAVDGVAVLVNRGFAPSAGVVPERRARGDRRGQPRDLQVGIRRGRAVSLHVDEPRGRAVVGHAERLLHLLGEHAGLLSPKSISNSLPSKYNSPTLDILGFV